MASRQDWVLQQEYNRLLQMNGNSVLYNMVHETTVVRMCIKRNTGS